MGIPAPSIASDLPWPRPDAPLQEPGLPSTEPRTVARGAIMCQQKCGAARPPRCRLCGEVFSERGLDQKSQRYGLAAAGQDRGELKPATPRLREAASSEPLC